MVEGAVRHGTTMKLEGNYTDSHGLVVTPVNFALSDPAYRRKIARQLNRGESLHALRRDLHYANQGSIGAAHQGEQTEQAWCLTLLTNAVITWTTEYYQLAVEQLRAGGRQVPDEVLAHISPAHSENVNFFGVISVDIEAELAKLDASGRRPLRAGDLGSAGFPAELTLRNKVPPSAAIRPWCGQRGPSSLRSME